MLIFGGVHSGVLKESHKQNYEGKAETNMGRSGTLEKVSQHHHICIYASSSSSSSSSSLSSSSIIHQTSVCGVTLISFFWTFFTCTFPQLLLGTKKHHPQQNTDKDLQQHAYFVSSFFTPFFLVSTTNKTPTKTLAKHTPFSGALRGSHTFGVAPTSPSLGCWCRQNDKQTTGFWDDFGLKAAAFELKFNLPPEI